MRNLIATIIGSVVLILAVGCGGGGTSDQVPNSALSTPSVTKVPDKTPAAEVKLTTGQKNAKRSVETYLSVMPFSRDGLIHQLVSFDKYTTADATWAVDQAKTNYKEQAVKSAQNYLDVTGFSRSGLVSQLQQFDKYTKAEAEYAADQVGL